MYEERPLSETLELFYQELERRKYGKKSMTGFKTCGKELLSTVKNPAATSFSNEIAERYLMDYHGISLYETNTENRLATKGYVALRMMKMLDDFCYERPFQCRYLRKINYPISEGYAKLLLEYEVYLQSLDRYSFTSRRGILRFVRQFFNYLDCNDVPECKYMTQAILTKYLDSLQGLSLSTLQYRCRTLKPLLRFLVEKGYHTEDLSFCIPTVPVYRYAHIPSVWKQDDLKKLLAAVDRGSPGGKRDYAILLIACQMGMRASDIKSLRLGNLKWSNEAGKSAIEIRQQKTGEPILIPLLPDVGWAIIEYLREGRPASDSPYVFLRHNAPFTPFEPNNGLNGIVAKYAKIAGIELTSEKKNGMHSLRHTFASNLVKNQTPLGTVSGLLGHTNTVATHTYIKVDLPSLRLCALNPLEVISVDG